MNTLLQERLASLGNAQMPMMMAEGGTVDTDPIDIADPQVQADLESARVAVPKSGNEALTETILSLMEAEKTAEDPTEAKVAAGLAEAAEVGTQAPLGQMAVELAQAGRGPDVLLAHLAPGEVVLPPQMMADPQFESAVEKRFLELDLNPEAYVAGSGIASLNPVTGLEEFGWFKKTWKSIKKVGKKVIKPIANVAQFIPGPWQPIAAMVSKGYAAYDSFKAGNPLGGIMSLAGAIPGGKGGFSFPGSGGSGGFSVPGFGGGTFNFPSGGSGGSGGIAGLLGNLGKAGSSGSGGIAGLLGDAYEYIMPGADNVGLLSNLGKTGSSIYEYVMPGSDNVGLLGNLGQSFGGKTAAEVLTEAAQGNPAIDQAIQDGMSRGLSFEQILVELQGSGAISPYAGRGVLGSIGEFIMPGRDDQGLFTNLGQFLGGTGGGVPGQMMPGGYFPGGGMGGGGGGFPGGMLGAAGLAGLIGKLVYDNTKNMKGVPLTPLTQMNAAGRYNIEAEIARRMGQQAPNPVEFGLLPQGTMPQLIGGSTGPVQGYKDGGNVDSAMFVRMTGDIDGPGSEVSDDIPAMLSDGEFVMTGRAVRGAGAFDMKNKNGVLTLTPSKEEDRDRGTDLMYEMMDVFAGRASPPPAGQGA